MYNCNEVSHIQTYWTISDWNLFFFFCFKIIIKAKKNICLFKLPRPTLIFTPPPPTLKVFMASRKCRREMSCPSVFTYELCQCLYEKGCIQRPKAPIQDQKAFQALNN